MPRSLLVGVIGDRVDRGWAKESYVLAVQKVTGAEPAAAATNTPAAADVSTGARDGQPTAMEQTCPHKVA